MYYQEKLSTRSIGKLYNICREMGTCVLFCLNFIYACFFTYRSSHQFDQQQNPIAGQNTQQVGQVRSCQAQDKEKSTKNCTKCTKNALSISHVKRSFLEHFIRLQFCVSDVILTITDNFKFFYFYDYIFRQKKLEVAWNKKLVKLKGFRLLYTSPFQAHTQTHTHTHMHKLTLFISFYLPHSLFISI